MDAQTRVTKEDALLLVKDRFTMEHVPAWALVPDSDGMYPAPQFESDESWLENTDLRYTRNGQVVTVITYPTWPLGMRLRSAYRIYRRASMSAKWIRCAAKVARARKELANSKSESAKDSLIREYAHEGIYLK